MGHYSVFERSAQDRKVLKSSGYPWGAFLFAPFWAFRHGLIPHGMALTVSYGICGLLMGFANNGIVAGVAVALWLGVFTAHNATDWLTSSYEKRGYKMTGRVEADSAKGALYNHRNVKRHGLLRELAS